MGLFGLFKKKGPTHKEKMMKLYQDTLGTYPPVIKKSTFPGDAAQLDIILHSLARIYGIALEESEQSVYDAIFDSYFKVVMQLKFEEGNEAHCVEYLTRRFGSLARNELAARRAVIFCLVNMLDWKVRITTPEDLKKLDHLADTRLADGKAQGSAVAAEDPEYGLVPGKPVPTGSIPGSRQFLAGLLSADGQKLQWTRRGSTHVPGVNGIVDIYDSVTPNGSAYKTVYVNIYEKPSVNRIPAGFRSAGK